MKKTVSSLFIICLLFVAVLSPALAVTDVKHDKVKLKNVYVDISYKTSQVKLERYEDNCSVKVHVVDKKTGQVLETYGEVMEKPKRAVGTNGVIGVDNYTFSTVYRDRTDGPAVSRLQTQLNIYSSGTFREIFSVPSTDWIEVSGGTWTHDNEVKSTISTTGKFPTTKIQTSGTATITIKTSTSVTGSFSVDSLTGAGFSLGHTSSSDYYYRKPISLGFTYSVY